MPRRNRPIAWVGFLITTAAPSSALAIEPYDSLVPGEWTVVSTNTIRDVDPCPQRTCSYSSVEGVSGVINDWCGGVYASGFGTLGAMIAWGGGHNGYFGSEIYAFDVATRQWGRASEPYDDGSSSVAAACTAEGVYPDGSACPTHTYNAIEYHPSTNRLVLLNGTADPVLGGSVDGRAHLFDFNAHSWHLGAQNTNPYSYDGPGAYDPMRDIYWQLYGYVQHLASYNPRLDQWQDYGMPGVWEIDAAGKVDPVHDLMIFIDGRGSGQVYAIVLATPTAPVVQLTTSGDTDIQHHGQIGFEWKPTTQRFVAWHDGADVYVLTPPAGDWHGTWTWARVPPAATNTVIPVANANGTYGRFRYAASINAFLLLSATDGPVWAYRLSPGAGTGPNPDGGVRDASSPAQDGATSASDAATPAPDATPPSDGSTAPADGSTDSGVALADAAPGGDAPQAPGDDAAGPGPSGDASAALIADAGSGSVSGSCGCTAVGARPGSPWAAALLLLVFSRRLRRRRWFP